MDDDLHVCLCVCVCVCVCLCGVCLTWVSSNGEDSSQTAMLRTNFPLA